METNRQTKAAQRINRPFPSTTVIPIFTWFSGFTAVFMAWDFFIITVQRLAPIKRSTLPPIEKMAETKNVRLFLAMPLLNKAIRIRR